MNLYNRKIKPVHPYKHSVYVNQYLTGITSQTECSTLIDDSIFIDGSCYTVPPTTTWFAARDLCKSINSTLAIFPNGSYENMLQYLNDTYPSNWPNDPVSFWIGLTRATWRWNQSKLSIPFSCYKHRFAATHGLDKCLFCKFGEQQNNCNISARFPITGTNYRNNVHNLCKQYIKLCKL